MPSAHDSKRSGQCRGYAETTDVDQTRQNPETVAGAVGTRLAQLTMMATFRETWEEVLEQASRLMREMYHVDGFDAVALHVEYVLAAQPEERHPAFGAALRRNVPGRGGELMNYVERMVEQGRREGMSNVERMVEQGRREGVQEGRQEGELRGRLQTIQGFLRRDVPWSTIEAATGIDEAAFRRLKQQFENGADHDE